MRLFGPFWAQVSEVRFINEINGEGLVEELKQRLGEFDARISAAAQRRSERLEDIAVRQKWVRARLLTTVNQAN